MIFMLIIGNFKSNFFHFPFHPTISDGFLKFQCPNCGLGFKGFQETKNVQIDKEEHSQICSKLKVSKVKIVIEFLERFGRLFSGEDPNSLEEDTTNSLKELKSNSIQNFKIKRQSLVKLEKRLHFYSGLPLAVELQPPSTLPGDAPDDDHRVKRAQANREWNKRHQGYNLVLGGETFKRRGDKPYYPEAE